jgi:hypothetical protein
MDVFGITARNASVPFRGRTEIFGEPSFERTGLGIGESEAR